MSNACLVTAVLIDAREFARLLSVSKQTIQGRLSDGRLPEPIRLTSRWLRTEADAGRVPCLRADGWYLFDVDAVKRGLSLRATVGEVDGREPKEASHA